MRKALEPGLARNRGLAALRQNLAWVLAKGGVAAWREAVHALGAEALGAAVFAFYLPGPASAEG